VQGIAGSGQNANAMGDDGSTRGRTAIGSSWPMWMLGLVVLSDQIDVAILRGVLSHLKSDFGLTDPQLGVLTSAFLFVNGLVTVPAGYFADRWNRTRTVGHTMLVWSGFTAMTAAAPNYGSLVAVRSALGFGQAITEPAANSLLADYYPLQERGRAYSIQQVMGIVGTAIGLGLAGLVAGWLGWRWAFLIVGSPSIVVAFMVYRLREPRRGESDRRHVGIIDDTATTAEEQKIPQQTLRKVLREMPGGLRADMKTIAAIPTMRYALAGVSVLLFVVTAISTWLPQFYERHHGVSDDAAPGLVGLLLVFGGIPGILLGGRMADRYVNRIRGGRVAVPAVCIASGNLLFMASYLHIPIQLVFGLQLVGIFVLTTAVPALRAGISDAIPAHLRGAGFGAFNLASVLGGQAAAPIILSLVSAAFDENLRTAFIIVSFPVFLGAWILYRARDHLEQDTQRIFEAVLRAMQEQQEREERERAPATAATGAADPDPTTPVEDPAP
jgi:MFS family permease